MPRLDVAPDFALLTTVLRDPARLADLQPVAFGRVMDAAHDARLLGWFVDQAASRGLPGNPPDWLHDRLTTAATLVVEYERALRWEIDRLHRAFLESDLTWVLLKGGAYVAAALTPGRGRRVADIDLLVPFDDLQRTERVLAEHGWAFAELNAYDTRYYREWMHELPPMVHRDRHTIIDVHHAILPRTSRLKPPSPRLLERAIETAPGVRVLCPAHMILHGAAHLFHDGEIAGAIRDVVDLDQLLREFGSGHGDGPAFWSDLCAEARALGLTRPAYYALRYTSRWFKTPVPDAVIAEAARWAPPSPVVGLMDALVTRAISGDSVRGSSSAAFALYVRSHWLRMPPHRVARHLLRKTFSGA